MLEEGLSESILPALNSLIIKKELVILPLDFPRLPEEM